MYAFVRSMCFVKAILMVFEKIVFHASYCRSHACNINGYLVYTEEANAQLSLSHLVEL